MRTKNPVKHVTRDQLKWHRVSLDQYPSAGPNANVTGMRQRYWGVDAPILSHGPYIYHVPRHIYDKF